MRESSQAAQKGPAARRCPRAAREAYSLYVERAAEGAVPPQMGLFQVRREGAAFSPVQVRPGELSVHPSSYRGGKKGNQLAEALGTAAHHGWVCESTGRNVCEARAGLEREVVSADPPE